MSGWQLLMDVYSDRTRVYVRPLKVWNRYSETMFLPHLYKKEEGSFSPIMEGVEASRFYEVMNRQQALTADQNMDSWDRFFTFSKQMYLQGMDITANCARMCDIMMPRAL